MIVPLPYVLMIVTDDGDHRDTKLVTRPAHHPGGACRAADAAAARPGWAAARG